MQELPFPIWFFSDAVKGNHDNILWENILNQFHKVLQAHDDVFYTTVIGYISLPAPSKLWSTWHLYNHLNARVGSPNIPATSSSSYKRSLMSSSSVRSFRTQRMSEYSWSTSAHRFLSKSLPADFALSRLLQKSAGTANHNHL